MDVGGFGHITGDVVGTEEGGDKVDGGEGL